MPADTFSVQPLIEAWRQASDDLKREIGALVLEAAERAATRIAQAYPERSGRLRGGVRTRMPRGWSVSEGAIVPARVVASTAPHTHFIEDGIAGRRRVPARPTFVPIVVEERQAYLRTAEGLLQRDRTVI